MPLIRCSLTGVDELTPLIELAVVSDLYPFVEWGFLYSPKRAGRPGRYPSVDRILRAFKDLPPYVNLALHVSDAGVPDLLAGEPVARELVDHLRRRGKSRARVQLNFDARAGEVDIDALRSFILKCPNLVFITQHNAHNSAVTEAMAGVPNHAVLFDDSLGRGIPASTWPQPLPLVTCGYAGGLGPGTLRAALPRIHAATAGAAFWIDMEGKLRDREDRFDMSTARHCLELVGLDQLERMPLPVDRPQRRQFESLALLDSGLTREPSAEAALDACLERLVQATDEVADPAVQVIRRQAQDLLERKGGRKPGPRGPSGPTGPQVELAVAEGPAAAADRGAARRKPG